MARVVGSVYVSWSGGLLSSSDCWLSVKGLPDDIYHMLHRSYVRILKMRRSIERADAQRAAVEHEG